MPFLFDDLLIWIGDKIRVMAEEELRGSEERIHEELLSLQAALETGGVSESEYAIREEELLARLEELQEADD